MENITCGGPLVLSGSDVGSSHALMTGVVGELVELEPPSAVSCQRSRSDLHGDEPSGCNHEESL